MLRSVNSPEPPARRASAAPGADPADADSAAEAQAQPEADEREPLFDGRMVMEQMGGVEGLISSMLPIVAFVPVNAVWGLMPAIWASLGVAVLLFVWRLVRRESLTPAISGLMGVGISAGIAWYLGEAKGFFLFGIWGSLVYGVVFLGSIALRWPIIGVVWGFLGGKGSAWRRHKKALHAYDIATAVWTVMHFARYLVQSNLYGADETGALGVTRLAMGWPLTAVAFIVTIWAARRADRIVEAAEAVDDEAGREPTSAEPRSGGRHAKP
jgi:hypothetical protein